MKPRKYITYSSKKSEARLLELIKLPLYPTHSQIRKAPQTKTVTVNGLVRVFGLDMDGEYYDGKLSLTQYLLSLRATQKTPTNPDLTLNMERYFRKGMLSVENSKQLREYIDGKRNYKIDIV